ncbi:MAG: hypothetical protein IJM25_08455 [Eubacterium sp.]|nr:hypothetical protein [Eubacterium sp.]
MGQTIGEASSYVFASMDADVTEPYGETAYQDEWVNGTYYGKDSFRNYDYPEKGRWRKNSNGWWYGDGKWFAKNQWQKIDGKWYYFDEKGYIVTGTRVIGGTEYRFDADGVYVGN